MPNDLTIDRNGWLYVADSLNGKVWIFDPNGTLAGSAGSHENDPGWLDFPLAITIAYRTTDNTEIGNLIVADQRQGCLHVFDLQGGYLRTDGRKITQRTRKSNWQGKFAKIQSLAIDTLGRLHAVDCFLNNIQILDAQTGIFGDAYGDFGLAPGQLNLPLDILLDANDVIIANTGNNRVESIKLVP